MGGGPLTCAVKKKNLDFLLSSPSKTKMHVSNENTVPDATKEDTLPAISDVAGKYIMFTISSGGIKVGVSTLTDHLIVTAPAPGDNIVILTFKHGDVVKIEVSLKAVESRLTICAEGVTTAKAPPLKVTFRRGETDNVTLVYYLLKKMHLIIDSTEIAPVHTEEEDLLVFWSSKTPAPTQPAWFAAVLGIVIDKIKFW